MNTYKLFSDSSCDLPDSLVEQFHINIVPFYVSFDQETYFREKIDLSNEAFYETLTTKKVFSKSSLPSVQDYINKFTPALKEGYDIICLCLSHKFSGSYQSAVNAKHILEEKYPNAIIHIIDSLQATAGQGLLLLQIANMMEKGLTIEELVEKVNIIKATTRIMFTVDDLDYLEKGGRIGKALCLASNMLDLKPLIQLKEGELIPYSNVRGRRRSLDKLYSMLEEHFQESGEKFEDYDFCIANATTTDDAQYLQSKVETLIGRNLPYPIFQIGVTIGTYTGPGAVGICFIKNYDRV